MWISLLAVRHAIDSFPVSPNNIAQDARVIKSRIYVISRIKLDSLRKEGLDSLPPGYPRVQHVTCLPAMFSSVDVDVDPHQPPSTGIWDRAFIIRQAARLFVAGVYRSIYW